jgi:hypothetical protein
MDELASRSTTSIKLGMPAFPEAAGRTITGSSTRPGDITGTP